MKMFPLFFLGILSYYVVIAVPPPASGPPNVISGEYDMKYGFYDADFNNIEECYAVLWQDLENGVAREDDTCFYLNYPYNQTVMFHIFYQRVIRGITRSWYAAQTEDGVWKCSEIISPFPKRNFLSTNCTYGGEDLIEAQETWKYDCLLSGPAGLVPTVFWIKQDPKVGYIVRNTQEPSPPFPIQIVTYLDIAPLPRKANLSRYVPPTITGCNIPLEWITFPS